MRGLILKVSGSYHAIGTIFASKAGVGVESTKGGTTLSLGGGSGASPGVSGKQSEALLSPG